MRAISALVGGVGSSSSEPEEPLELRVANISADIAAALAQVHSRTMYDDDEEEEEEGESDDSGEELKARDTLGLKGPRETRAANGEPEEGEIRSTHAEREDDGMVAGEKRKR